MHASKDKGKLTKDEREKKTKVKTTRWLPRPPTKVVKSLFHFFCPGACVLAEANMSKRMAPKASRGRLH